MKKKITFLICLGVFITGALLAFSQEKEETDPEKKVSQVLIKSASSYNPAGRRDPFKDLLEGRDIRTPAYVEGVPQIFIDDVVLTGIVKSRGKFTAIINDGHGFPYYIKEGDKLADGFVQSVEESRVVFRKTHERGIPLLRPKDIIKEI